MTRTQLLSAHFHEFALPNAKVRHRKRPRFSDRQPQLVTLRVKKEVGNLRTEESFAAIKSALRAGSERCGIRLVDFSVQEDHILLVVEADTRTSLSRGIQGLSVRIARAVNRTLSRRGKVFADRYHARILKTPSQVRDAVDYVRQAFKLRLMAAGVDVHPFYIDPYSSMSGEACTFMHSYDRFSSVVAVPRTSMLCRMAA
jgi:REP element-mobilizing transposase RayT